MHRRPRNPLDDLPDVRDGLTRVERVILYVLWETQRERGDRNVPTAMLYGRVVERIDMPSICSSSPRRANGAIIRSRPNRDSCG